MTQFFWRYRDSRNLKLGTFLYHKGVSKALMRRVKFHGGEITVNHCVTHTNYQLRYRDLVGLTLPPEPSNPNVMVSNQPIQVAYENKNYLIVDKPSGMTSVPSKKYGRDTLVNRVKGYYYRHHYPNLEIHIVTRLDRVTSGLVIFAKNHLAHSILDRESKHDEITKQYLAVVSGRVSIPRGMIVLPLDQDPDSLIKQKVTLGGKYAKTEFRVIKATRNLTALRVKLDTGRTHQIRVHFKTIGHPLVGDWLYNPDDHRLNRLALHCCQLRFYDPLDSCWIKCRSRIPEKIRLLIN